MRRYEEELQEFLDYQAGKDEEGDHASLPSGAIPAQHGAPPPVEEPPERPDKPERPMTVIEHELAENDAHVRNVIINHINKITSTELISPEGEAKFKQDVIDELNEDVKAIPGEIVGMIIGSKVTT
jgi:hypothetical protein